MSEFNSKSLISYGGVEIYKSGGGRVADCCALSASVSGFTVYYLESGGGRVADCCALSASVSGFTVYYF
jgi:hypothetical protein